MAADILGYDAELVPVGKDQIQHLEMTRDIATAFNNAYGETFVLPKALIDEKIMTIPGVDGQKMSKSYNNYIDVFLPEKELKKQVMSIISDSKGLEEPKDPDASIIFKLYSLLAPESDIQDMRTKYLAGNYGYGHAKTALFELIMSKYVEQRRLFNQYMNNLPELDNELKKGADKARSIISKVLDRAREKAGY